MSVKGGSLEHRTLGIPATLVGLFRFHLAYC